jgi:hypothetical protein|tara:strand:- start:182 stop:346 length:165 start_codon:yes stop_codon:yes gene_type:complete
MNDGSLSNTANFLDSLKSEKARFLNLKYSTQCLSIDPKKFITCPMNFQKSEENY